MRSTSINHFQTKYLNSSKRICFARPKNSTDKSRKPISPLVEKPYRNRSIIIGKMPILMFGALIGTSCSPLKRSCKPL